jgi:predicted acylesterase/phospholipase RssA
LEGIPQIRAVFRRLFGELSEAQIEAVVQQGRVRGVLGGEQLIRQGDAGTSLFVLLSGRLRVSQGAGEDAVVIRDIAPGDSVGEMSLLSTQRRSASVHAVRDSRVLELDSAQFQRVGRDHPQILSNLAGVVIRRLEGGADVSGAVRTECNVVVLAAGPGVSLHRFVDSLQRVLAPHGATCQVDEAAFAAAQPAAGARSPTELTDATGRWLTEVEGRHRFVLFPVQDGESAWAQTCVRQADRVLIVADASDPVAVSRSEAALLQGDGPTRPRRSLVLLHPESTDCPEGTRAWLAPRSVADHHHLRRDRVGDFERLARFLSGCSVGLVLSGGGCRGFAFVGGLRALTEADVPIDMIGGTSIGAIVAAQYARFQDPEAVYWSNRYMADHDRFTREYTLPLISLLSGKSFDRTIERECIGRDIEDMWIPFFCVSANLSQAAEVVHRRGSLWRAVRASASIPGLLPPVQDGDSILIDGGVFNNLPGDVMRRHGARLVVAMDASPEVDLQQSGDALPSPWQVVMHRVLPGLDPVSFPSAAAVLMRTMVLSGIRSAREGDFSADLLLCPELADVGMLDLHRLDDIVERGYAQAVPLIADWLQRGGLASVVPAAPGDTVPRVEGERAAVQGSKR